MLILEPRKNPSFDVVFNVSTPHQWFACAYLPDPHLPRSYAVTFPKRSLPWLLTNAAFGGLKPAPASRLRGACPHLSHSYARLRSISYTRSWRTILPILTLTHQTILLKICITYRNSCQGLGQDLGQPTAWKVVFRTWAAQSMFIQLGMNCQQFDGFPSPLIHVLPDLRLPSISKNPSTL